MPKAPNHSEDPTQVATAPHAMAQHRCSVALVLIDVINDLEWDNGHLIEPQARAMSAAIAALKKRAKKLEIPVIYVNDNFGQWRSDFQSIVDHVLKDGVRGEFLARELAPESDDYFVLKPKHSGFFGTTFEILLDYLGVSTVVLTGLAGNICVLFTANVAYMRDMQIFVPRDGIASNTKAKNDDALYVMESVLKADTRLSAEIEFETLIASSQRQRESKILTSSA